ncbi:hypothetical protein GGF42_005480, partial [Coemansia sp. RSA 2424]
MADRMTSFIDEHYPSPVPVNYRAMSNYLWIDVDGCMRMYGIFRGKFKWTKADLERATELRAQGLSFTEVSRLVEEYTGKYTVVEIVSKIRAQLSLASKPSYYDRVASLIAAHPHYKAKLRDIDYTDLANRIALGQTTVKLAAKELDVPRAVLAKNMESMHSKLYASQWTDEETRKLIDY